MRVSKTSKELVVALFLMTVFLCVVVGDIHCKYDEFVVEDIVGNLSCVPCKTCGVGMGLLPQCGSYIQYGAPIECKPCIDGISYSTTSGIDSCQPCGICADHQKVKEKCNKRHNSKCAENCDTGFYLSPVVGDCQECSWCCADSGPSEHEDQCKKSGVPFYKQCKIGESLRCQPRCTDQQYIIVSESLNKTCANCPLCKIGKGLSHKCQSVFSGTNKPTCVDCIPGKTFSNTKDSSSCQPCTACEVGKKTERTCNRTHDTLCGDCSHGFYEENNRLNKKKTCKECSYCCGDKEDVVIPECKVQGMSKRKQCSYTTRAVTKCRPKDLMALWIALPVGLFVVLVIVIALWLFKKKALMDFKKTEYQRIREATGLESQMEETPAFRMGKELPSQASRATNIEFKQSGINVQCQDEVGEDLLNTMSVEICWDEHQHLPDRNDEIYLSPLIKLHPHGYQPSTQIQLDIPHSAYKQEFNSSWSIKIFTQTLSTKGGSPIELNELFDQEMEISHCSVKFRVKELAAYVVVGIPGDLKLAKKRMQCAVFGAEPRIGQIYSLNLYLLDDGESSFQKLKQEEERQGRHLLQKLFRSLYPDSDNKSVIDVTIDNVKEGWSCEPLKQVIQGYEWIQSYKKDPKVEVKFKNTNPQIRDFHCTFKVTFKDKTVEIPVFHFSEPEKISTGVQPSDENSTNNIYISNPTVNTMPSQVPSPRPLSSLPNEVLTKFSQAIDDESMESVAREMNPSITPDDLSLITSSNQPLVVLVDMAKKSNLSPTIDELGSILQAQGLDSAVQQLQPYMYETTPHV